jgi:2-keto-4-pentenoate hydratase/2-oxohepta-3-ene-1,7-dioic acid hydratase in catechol pathway
VWTRDVERGLAVAEQLECGTGWVNQHGALSPFAPFGGSKWSGIGYENGPWGLAAFTELGGDAPAEPIFFAKLPDALCGPGDPVVIPRWLDTRVDHEAELALILGFDDPDGRGRKDVIAADAPSLVAGYTALNDVTARKLQGQDREQKYPWLRSKSLDTFCPFGPFVVPSDAIDGGDLQLTMRVNGEVRQQARTSAMVFSIGEALAAMSRVTTLRPGDLIAMGTPEGVGPVVNGDLMEVEIEKIGVLRNPVRKV